MSKMFRLLFVWIVLLVMPSFVLADEVTLKSGKTVSGEIVERTEDFIKINSDGVAVTLFAFEIESVREGSGTSKSGEALLPLEESGEALATKELPGVGGGADVIRQLFRDRKYSQIIDFTQKALLKNPNSPQLYISAGMAYYMLGDYKKAVEQLEKGLDLDQSNEKAYSFLGAAYQSLGEKKKAIEAYSRFVELFSSTNPLGAEVFSKMLEYYSKN